MTGNTCRSDVPASPQFDTHAKRKFSRPEENWPTGVSERYGDFSTTTPFFAVLEVTPVTAVHVVSGHTCIMQRVVDESEYVLRVLRSMRDEASANPGLYDPDARKRMDEAIARVEDVLRYARSQLMVGSAEQNQKAA